MAYRFDTYDNSIVIDGWENGIAADPYDGIANLVNANITSVPGQVSVGFSLANKSPANISGATVNSINTTTGLASLSGVASLEDNMCVYFTVAPIGFSTNTPYWVYGTTISGNGGSAYFSATYGGNTPVIPTSSSAGVFSTYNMEAVNTIERVENPTLGASWKTVFILDISGQVWSNYITTTSGKFTFTGNTGTFDGFYDNGLNGMAVFINYLFVFHTSHIDYVKLPTSVGGAFTWTYSWSATTLLSNYPHFALAATDQTLYVCDGQTIHSYFQTDPSTPFDPATSSTYTKSDWNLLPYYDYATCLAQLGTNLLIGGIGNVVYPWDRYDTHYTEPLYMPEKHVFQIVPVNAQAYVFAGYRGRIYVTNGSSIQLFTKIPDHLSNTLVPYYTWGGATFQKNQLYFGIAAQSNDQGSYYAATDGVWAIDLATNALRLESTFSTGQNNGGYASAIYAIPDITPGYGLIAGHAGIGVSAGTIEQSVSSPYTNMTTTIDTDMIPIGTYLQPRAFTQVEYLLAKPLASGESITLYSRTDLQQAFQELTGSADTNISSAGVCNMNTTTSQWIQLRAVLNSTMSSPNYVPLKQLRITGLAGKTLATSQILGD